MIAAHIGVKVETVTNPEYIRPNDNMEIVGTAYKIESEFGWKREYSLEQTISDMVTYMSKNM